MAQYNDGFQAIFDAYPRYSCLDEGAAIAEPSTSMTLVSSPANDLRASGQLESSGSLESLL
jgi:hypothetical protein